MTLILITWGKQVTSFAFQIRLVSFKETKPSNGESLAALVNVLDNFGITYTAIEARGGPVS